MTHTVRQETVIRLTAQGRYRLEQKQYGFKPWETLVRSSHQTFSTEREAQQQLYLGQLTWSGWMRRRT